MSDLATLLGTYAPGHVLSHAGMDFVFSRVDQRTKVALTVAYFRRARESLYEIKEELSEEEYERQLSRVTDAYRRGEYAFPLGESFGYYLGEGFAQLVAALTGRGVLDCERLVDERQVEALHVVLCVISESSAVLKKTMLHRAADPRMGPLLDLLSISNGSPSPKNISPRDSPSRAWAPTSTPD